MGHRLRAVGVLVLPLCPWAGKHPLQILALEGVLGGHQVQVYKDSMWFCPEQNLGVQSVEKFG